MRLMRGVSCYTRSWSWMLTTITASRSELHLQLQLGSRPQSNTSEYQRPSSGISTTCPPIVQHSAVRSNNRFIGIYRPVLYRPLAFLFRPPSRCGMAPIAVCSSDWPSSTTLLQDFGERHGRSIAHGDSVHHAAGDGSTAGRRRLIGAAEERRISKHKRLDWRYRPMR